jgi:hypothetical protein
MKQFSSRIGIALGLVLMSSVVAFPTPAFVFYLPAWISAPLRTGFAMQ